MKWYLDESSFIKPEILTGPFTWAQWDCDNQVLFYIYVKPKAKSLSMNESENDQNSSSSNTSHWSPSKEQVINPTLSALQFNNDQPTETVVSIVRPF